MSDTDIDDELFAFHLYLDSLSQDVRDRLLTELNKQQAPVQQDIDTAISKVDAAREALASAEAAFVQTTADASAIKRRARKSVRAMPLEETAIVAE